MDCPIRKENVSIYSLGKEWFLHDNNQGNVHVINETARFIWELCDGRHTPEEMESEIKGSYDVSPDRHLIENINSILRQFQQLGLLDAE
jgi:hypothetical protein